jgi:hypothetical protein
MLLKDRKERRHLVPFGHPYEQAVESAAEFLLLPAETPQLALPVLRRPNARLLLLPGPIGRVRRPGPRNGDPQEDSAGDGEATRGEGHPLAVAKEAKGVSDGIHDARTFAIRCAT